MKAIPFWIGPVVHLMGNPSSVCSAGLGRAGMDLDGWISAEERHRAGAALVEDGTPSCWMLPSQHSLEERLQHL